MVVEAAKVGEILAKSSYPTNFLHDSLMIAANCINAAHSADVNRLLFLGRSCIYPKFAHQPTLEEALLRGVLESANEWYAAAKIAGINLCQAYRRQHGRGYICAIPTNLDGPGDSFDLNNSHVLPTLICKAHETGPAGSTATTIGGTVSSLRGYLHASDCADACVHPLQHYSEDMYVNVASGEDIAIRTLAEMVCDVIGFTGIIDHDPPNPDGTIRKLMSADRSRAMGWVPEIALREGIASAYRLFLDNPR